MSQPDLVGSALLADAAGTADLEPGSVPNTQPDPADGPSLEEAADELFDELMGDQDLGKPENLEDSLNVAVKAMLENGSIVKPESLREPSQLELEFQKARVTPGGVLHQLLICTCMPGGRGTPPFGGVPANPGYTAKPRSLCCITRCRRHRKQMDST
jgi:hypothetical protein